MRKILSVIIAAALGLNVVLAYSNDFFTASGVPATGAALNSATMRGEFDSIEAGFDKMPTLTGNGNKVVTVNAGGTALSATAATALSGMVIGTNLQAWDADLDAIAALAKTDGNFVVGDGSTWVAESGATARTSLGFTDPILDKASPGAIGASTPAAISGTTGTYTGLVDISGASAGQIKFPATQNASADANTLDDYKESTWTPDIGFTSNGDLSVAYSTQVGHYTKIGRIVILTFSIQTTTFTHGTATGDLKIIGLPFTSITATGYIANGTLQWQGITKATHTQVNAYVASNSAIVSFRASGSGTSVAAIGVSDMPTGGTVILNGTITYTAAN